MAQISREALIARVTEIAERAGAAEEIEVVEVEFSGSGKARVLRIFIDKPTGVTHTDCEAISQSVSEVLDAEDLVPGDHYHLEVSSPGVERKLVRPKDYTRFAGQKAKIVLTEAVENQKHWEGTLRGLEGDAVALEAQAGRVVHIPLGAIRRANLKFQW
jgi:ribosome maturation factor RimP